jgi:hypothetical protein
LSSKARLRRAARKKTIATEIEMAHGDHATGKYARGTSLVATSKFIVHTRQAYATQLKLPL